MVARRRRSRSALGIALAAVAAASSVAPAGAETVTISTAATATTHATRVAPPRRSMLVVAGGDILTESRVLDVAAAVAPAGKRYDLTAPFAAVAPLLSAADLAICHMELPIGAPGARPGVYGRSRVGGNLLLAPYELAADLKAVGFDRCSTASNHSHDLGIDGIATTLAALGDAGLGHSGTARSTAEAEPAVFAVNGIAVAHLSYTTFANEPPLPEPWMNFAGSVGEVAAAVRAARAAGAEIVILSLHIAKEMLSTPMSYDRAFVEQLTSSVRVDLVVEHGPHVIQPVEVVNGAVVFWSVGNMLSAMGVPGTGKYEDQRTLDGLIAGVRFTEVARGDFAADVSAVLVCNEKWTRAVHAAVTSLAEGVADPELRAQLEACVARSRPVVPALR